MFAEVNKYQYKQRLKKTSCSFMWNANYLIVPVGEGGALKKPRLSLEMKYFIEGDENSCLVSLFAWMGLGEIDLLWTSWVGTCKCVGGAFSWSLFKIGTFDSS